jgi:hypothetical protein
MKKQGKIAILVVAIVILLSTVAALSFYQPSGNIETTGTSSNINSDNATNSSRLNTADNESKSSTQASDNTAGITLGSTSYGTVVKEGPYGNKNSPVKVAYIVGVHPLESNAHKAAVAAIKSHDGSLNKCYYIYRVIVTQDASNYDKGRMNGQLLAQKFVVPDIKSNGFQLAVDVHSNRGNYGEKRFVFAPVEGGNSESIARSVANKIPGFVYHFPFSQTSPKYVTVPLINAGIPAIIFETYLYEPYSATKSYVDKLVMAVDDI